jgi:hypothetical protein
MAQDMPQVEDSYTTIDKLVNADVAKWRDASDDIIDSRDFIGDYSGSKKERLDKAMNDALDALKADLGQAQALVDGLKKYSFQDQSLQKLLDQVQADWPRCNTRMSMLANGNGHALEGFAEVVDSDLHDVLKPLADLRVVCEQARKSIR